MSSREGEGAVAICCFIKLAVQFTLTQQFFESCDRKQLRNQQNHGDCNWHWACLLEWELRWVAGCSAVAATFTRKVYVVCPAANLEDEFKWHFFCLLNLIGSKDVLHWIRRVQGESRMSDTSMSEISSAPCKICCCQVFRSKDVHVNYKLTVKFWKIAFLFFFHRFLWRLNDFRQEKKLLKSHLVSRDSRWQTTSMTTTSFQTCCCWMSPK